MKRRGFLAFLFVAPFAKAVAKVIPKPECEWTKVRPTVDFFSERAGFGWREQHAGLVITWSELKSDGITILDSGFINDESKRRFVKLVEHKVANI